MPICPPPHNIRSARFPVWAWRLSLRWGFAQFRGPLQMCIQQYILYNSPAHLCLCVFATVATVAPLWLHCHHLSASFVTSCPLLPSSSSSSTHFHTLNRGFCLGTHLEILSPLSSFFKGHHRPLLYLRPHECVFVRVFSGITALNSSIKAFARSQGGTRPFSPADIHLNTEGQSRRRLSQNSEWDSHMLRSRD